MLMEKFVTDHESIKGLVTKYALLRQAAQTITENKKLKDNVAPGFNDPECLPDINEISEYTNIPVDEIEDVISLSENTILTWKHGIKELILMASVLQKDYDILCGGIVWINMIFYMGKSFDAYTQLGAHYFKGGTYFCTFAPNAARVSVIGEFNNWTDYDMNRADSGGLWEITIPDADVGQMYKYRIYQRNGAIVDHCDPYGYGSELRPANASIIRDMHNFKFGDREWMMHQLGDADKPLNIYEVAAGSFRKKAIYRQTGSITKSLPKYLFHMFWKKGITV